MAEQETGSVRQGGCLCGAVRYQVSGPLRPVVACHCGQCRRTSGHHVAATMTRRADLRIEDDAAITWYRASDQARRGFCRVCGGQLFWEKDGADTISIFAGSLDQPSGLQLAEHIFVEDKADYYQITDELPKRPQGGTQTRLPGRG